MQEINFEDTPDNRKARAAFDTLLSAAEDGRLVMVASKDIRTGRDAFVVYAQEGAGLSTLRPLCRMFAGYPFNEVSCPGMDAPKVI